VGLKGPNTRWLAGVLIMVMGAAGIVSTALSVLSTRVCPTCSPQRLAGLVTAWEPDAAALAGSCSKLFYDPFGNPLLHGW